MSGHRLTTGLLVAVLASACAGGGATPPHAEACLDCHRGLEHASASHAGCVSCHGGEAAATTRDAAHRGLYGLSNPSFAGRWEKGCGSCHRHQLERVRSSPMYTNAGMIRQIQATWEGKAAGIDFAAVAGQSFDPRGGPIEHRSVAQLDHLSGELYRKFCARCHVARQNDAMDGAGHPAGCAACHFPYSAGATYRGGDPTMRGKSPFSATHEMQGLPPMSACLACHQRSGRHALSYQGLLDGNNGLVPTRDGGPGPIPASDDRSFSHIAPDVHFAAGMECIDCHTAREVMGDGYAAPEMAAQLEVRCEDCHGDGARRPQFAAVARESDPPVLESKQYAVRLGVGERAALTSRGRPFSNVVERDGEVVLFTKRAGKRLVSPVVTGSPEHHLAGHERLTCAACHSRSVVQCYGCHTSYDKRGTGWDFVANQDTPGFFSETEDVRSLYPFPLALDRSGRISPVTPGCQTFVTVVEPDGTRSLDDRVLRYRGQPQLRFAAFFGHNTGDKAIGCVACHGNPQFFGFGQHVIENGTVRGTLLCEKNPKKPLDGFLAIEAGRIVSHAAITREDSRPLDHDEVRAVLSVNLCLPCHPRADDPVYRKPLRLEDLDDATHRRALARLR